jgi:hypothetical protein
MTCSVPWVERRIVARSEDTRFRIARTQTGVERVLFTAAFSIDPHEDVIWNEAVIVTRPE